MKRPTTNYSEIWESLEAAAGDEARRPRAKVVRDMGGIAGLRGFLGLALPERKRQLLIQMPADAQIAAQEFPHWVGLEVGVFEGDVADVQRGHFLVLGERGREPTAVYAALIQDLWERVAGLDDWETVVAELRAHLARWGDFFSEIGVRGLSLPAQRGLFGELWFIGNHLASSVGMRAALEGWIGHRRAHQDFQMPSAAIEVKTSIAKQLIEVRIANERQLDDRGLPALYLAVLLITELETGGESLPSQVGELRALAAADGDGATFEEKLLDAGYLDEQAHLYSRGYVLRSLHAYRVTTGFPRLLEEDLPTGIGDVSYSVDLATAKPFEVSTSEPAWWGTSPC